MSHFTLDWPELSVQVIMTFTHFLWQACVVGLLLLVAQQLRGAALRYKLACLAFFLLPICVATTFTWVHQSRGPFLLAKSEPTELNTVAGVIAFEPPSRVVVMDVSVLPPKELPSETEFSLAKSFEATSLGTPAHSFAWLIQSYAPYLLITYAIGVAHLLIRFTLSIADSSRLRRTIHPIADLKLLSIIIEQSARLGLKQVPVVSLCQRVSVPVVVGIVNPMILLPPALLCGLDPNQLVAILSHEMAHIRRHDLLINLLQRVVEALLFFHPVTWWISRRMSIERENCCDDVAAACTDRLSYASTLLQMAELCISSKKRRRAALASLSADGGNTTDFGYRLRRLIDAEETTHIGVTRRSITVGLTTLSLLLVSLVAWGPKGRSADEKPKDEAMSKIFTPEPLWQTKVSSAEVADEMTRTSPVVVAADRVLTIGKDLDLRTGENIENPLARRPREYEFGVTLEPAMRRKSSDRKYIVEIANRAPGNTWSTPSFDIRVLRAIDGSQIGVTIVLGGYFDATTCDVDIENGGNFLVLCTGYEVQVYRTETGQIESAMPGKIKRVDAVAFSPDREWLVVSDQNDLHFWRWREQAPVKTIHAGRKIDSLLFTPDGQYLSEGPDCREDIQIRDMRTLEIVASLKDEVGSQLIVSSMDITPDGRYLVAHNEVSVDRSKLTVPHRVHVWDLKTRGEPVFQIATDHQVRRVAFSDDGRMIVGEFNGAAHGALLAAWTLPDELLHYKVDSPRDAKDRLGDGIQWSSWGDKEGLLSGARLILPEGGLKPGQPLVVEYRLANVLTEKKLLMCNLNKGVQFASLSRGNRITGFGLEWHRETVSLTIEPGDVFIDTEHLVAIDTSGLEPGEYFAELGSAFHFPDSVEPNTTHEIPHRGSIPFTLVGKPTATVNAFPKGDIHWGETIAGLQIGARFTNDPTAFAFGTTVEADLFVANVTNRLIECSVALPHPGDGWVFKVESENRTTITLERRPPIDSFSPQRYVHLKLAPGEIAPVTGEGINVSLSSIAADESFITSLPKVRFQIVDTIDEAIRPWQSGGNNSIQGRLVSRGGLYSAIFELTLLRPEIPALRLELASGSVPFTVVGDPSKAATSDDEVEPNEYTARTVDLKDENVGAFVEETLRMPYQPDVNGASWQLGAHIAEIMLTLDSIPQRELVADALIQQVEAPITSFPGGRDATGVFQRQIAIDYCASRFANRLIPSLIKYLQDATFPEAGASTTPLSISTPPYAEIRALGDIGEPAREAIPILLKLLDSKNSTVREEAIEALVRVAPNSNEVLPAIAGRFHDENESVQSTAVYQAGRYGRVAKTLGTEFTELLNAKSVKVQCWAAAALISSEFNPELGFKKLLEISRTGPTADRRQALTALAMLGMRSESILPVLRTMVDDPDAEVANEVRETIRRIESNDRIVTHAEEAAKKVADQSAAALAEEILVVGSLTPIDIHWGEPVDGMRLGIRLSESAKHRSPLRHGEHIEYEVWIKNETDEDVRISRDPRDLYSPRLIDDQSINVIGSSTILSFDIPQETLSKAELILPPGQAAKRFPMQNHSATLRSPGSPRGRFGLAPLLAEPGRYPVYAQLGELKSGVKEVEILPAARLQIREANEVTAKRREDAAKDPSDEILGWQTSDSVKHEAIVNWDHGVLADEGDLASVEITPVDNQPEQFAILLQLRPEATAWFARQTKALSEMQEPKLLAILLDGKPLGATRLDSSIPDGKVVIAGRFTKEVAEEIASRLRSAKNANWITAPQVCLGKAYSDSAKVANWQRDEELRVSLATPESTTMFTNSLPGAYSDFVVQVKLRLVNGAQCRVIVGDATYDMTNSSDQTKLLATGREFAFDNDDKAREWTLLRVERRGNKMSVQVNKLPEVDLGTYSQAIKEISLQSISGTIAVSNFAVTGDLRGGRLAEKVSDTFMNKSP